MRTTRWPSLSTAPTSTHALGLYPANRKAAIAAYHYECLLNAYQAKEMNPLPGQAPIFIQAHFEGILLSCISAADLMGKAIHETLSLDPNDEKRIAVLVRLRRRIGRLPQMKLRTDLCSWSQAPILRDVVDIRNNAAHAYYDKTHPNHHFPGIGDWEVQEPHPKKNRYSKEVGARSLRVYARRVVEHLAQLNTLIPDLERFHRQSVGTI